MKLKAGEHFENQNGEEWVVAQAFEWPDYVDYTLHRMSDGEIGFLREKKITLNN